MILACVAIAAVTVMVVAWVFRPQPPAPVVVEPRVRSLLDERLLDRVVVTLKSGTSFAGLLYAEDHGAVVLCNAEQLQPDGTTVPADGEIVVFRSDVDFVQRP